VNIQADITTYFVDKGNKFYVNGTCTPLPAILDDLSITTVRLAVFSLGKPMYNYNEAFKLVKASGKKLFLDIHCSDYWADPSHQRIPVSWDFKDLNGLRDCFLSYIGAICEMIKDSEVDVEYVQIGNEITNGMLWPYLSELSECARFLRMSFFYVRDFFPLAKIVLHTDLSGFPEKAARWYQTMNDNGVICDIAGLSYYPVWHGTIKTLKETITRVHSSIQKPITLCEIGYMNTKHKTTAWFGDWQCGNIPYSPIGQAEYIRHLLSQLEEVKDIMIPELFYWGGFSFISQEHFPVALFDRKGNALPVYDTIRKINQA